jgi:hypothetical protein
MTKQPNMKKIIIALAAAMMMAAPMMAQDAHSGASTQVASSKTDTPWYLSLDYGGFTFEIPAGSIVEKGSTLVARYPDGTFGISVSNQESIGSDQQRAFQLCRMLAKQMELTDAEVKKINVDGVAGARATGKIENSNVNVLILPYHDQEVTAVIMSADSRQEWADHLIQTIKH